jgi:hypothetical protein
MRHLALCLTLLLIAADATLAQSRPAVAERTPRPAGRSIPGLRVGLYEVIGKLELLREFKPADLDSVTGQSELEKRLSSHGFMTQAIMFVANQDLSAPSRLTVGTRVPFALPGSDFRRKGISYGEVGATLELSASQPPHHAQDFTLPVRLTIASFPSQAGGRPEKATFERPVKLMPDRTKYVMLDDAPVPTTEGMARLRLASFLFKSPVDTRPAAESRPGLAPADRVARVELNGLQLSASAAQMKGLDLTTLIAARPSIADLLEKLKGNGTAFGSAAISITCDLSKETRLTQGERVPTVQDMVVSRNGVVTPSVTYEEIGTILTLGPAQWVRSGDDWLLTTELRLEASGIGQSAVTVATGISLPTFTQFKTREQVTFRSGVPEYFLSTGPPSPAPDGNTTTSVLRVVLTRPDR